jgi:protein-S-isoprenylcysteine O-methyltransferase Ste14
VIPIEQSFLKEKFGDEYERYTKAVKKWLFF